nr:DUF2069 domain-containing protein [Halorhodospira neutriphila]
MMAAWLLWLDPPGEALRSIALLSLLGPLALTLRGVLQGRRYTVAWSAVVVVIYFVHGITYVAVPGPGQALGALELALVAAYFTSAMAYLRLATAARTGSREQRAP